MRQRSILAIGVLIAAALQVSAAEPLAATGPATPAPVRAQSISAPIPPPAPPPSTASVLAHDQQTLAGLNNAMATTSNDDRLATMGAQVAAIETQANQLTAKLRQDLAAVLGLLKRLHANPRGLVPVSRRAEVAALTLARNSLQAQLTQAQTVGAAANSSYALIAARRREGFSARVLERSAAMSLRCWGCFC